MQPIHLFLVLLVGITIMSCGSDDNLPQVINEEETITTVKLTVTESGTSNSMTYVWREKSADDITLKANTVYNASVQFLDESNPNEIEDITEEVIEEKDEHFIFYETTVTGVSFVSASDDILDTNDIGIHIKTNLSTGDIGTGIIKVFLIHEPTSKKGNSRSELGGETDVEVDFNIEIN